MYADILVPTDGSPGAEAAIEHAVSLADRYDAVIHAMYVSNARDIGEQSVELTDDVESELLKKAQAALDLVTTAAEEAGIEVVAEIRGGTPHEYIVEYASEEEIDLIAMGTHGKRGLSRMLLGSTAEKVVRRAPMPVLTVRPDGAATGGEYDDLLLPVDGSGDADHIVGDGISIAKAYGATIHAMYVSEESAIGDISPLEGGNSDELESEGRAATEPIIEAAETGGVTVEEVYDRGTPHEEILRYADEVGIDLVVLPTHAKTGIEQVVANDAGEEIIRRSPVPVLSVNRPVEER